MSDPSPTPVPQRDVTPVPEGRRSWRSRFLELFLWFLVAVVTAVILVLLSEEILPANF
jgi:hypothetical protein